MNYLKLRDIALIKNLNGFRKEQNMKKLVVIFILSLFVLPVLAEEQEVTQEIKSSKGFATVNLDSQITPEGKIKKQKITNDHSAFNININRNTYKFYCDTAVSNNK